MSERTNAPEDQVDPQKHEQVKISNMANVGHNGDGTGLPENRRVARATQSIASSNKRRMGR